MRASGLSFILALIAAGCGDTPPPPPPPPPPGFAPPITQPAPPPLATPPVANRPPADGPTAPGTTPTPTAAAPAGYLAGFPWLPGGTMQESPPGPPGLRTVIVSYPMPPAALTQAVQAVLQSHGWAVEISPPSPRGTQRIMARKDDRTVRVSVMSGPGGPNTSALLLMPM